MHISFDNKPSSNVDKVTTVYRAAVSGPGRAEGGYALDISESVTDNAAYGFFGSRKVHGRTAEEVMQAAGCEDVTLYRNYMTVMSNSMSDEDFAKLQKDGYNPMDMDIETAVTIVDTIKAELIKAGVDVAGYTDNVDMEVLAEITGSVSFAESLAKAFAVEDVPATGENVRQAMEAFRRGQELTEMSDGAVKYMVTNGMEPDIDSLYLAQHAGAVDADRQGRGYFKEELPGYYARKAADADLSKLQDQIEKIIEKAGYPVTEETLRDGMWLIEKGVPLTEKSFYCLEEVKQVTLPAGEEQLLTAIAGALAEGRPAGEANLADGRSIYRKAADCFESYEEKYRAVLAGEPTAENIKARRQLEEIRLHMTLEANVKLLKSGFSIDTAPMEDMIEALKKLEQQRTGADFAAAAPAELAAETLKKTGEIPYLPVTALGRILSEGRSLTVDTVYETGQAQREAYRQAGEAYETMQTAPRADMGDSIKTAFRNVDALLEGMGLELNDENRRAVRSLSYNHMELNEENLLAVKGAEKTVRSVVEKMSPPAVLDLIREGINPLKTSMEELDAFLSARDSYPAESEKYSRFLHNLEESSEITAAEKESYIGIYRLLRQIEKSDGAVIGNLVNTQAEVNFKNLLSAVRTGKVKGVDISVTAGFGSLEEAIEKGVSIDAQIETAYEQSLLQEAREISNIGDETIRLLQQAGQPVTIDNLLAADAIRQDGAGPFRKLAEARKKAADETETEEISLEMELPEGPVDREYFQNAYGSLLEQSENLAKAMTFAGTESLDVRAMQLVCKQLHIQGARALQEEYDLPQLIGGELTAVHLKLVHDGDTKGKVSVGVDTAGYGYLSGIFFVDAESVSGYFTGEGKEALEVLEETAQLFSGRLKEAGLQPGSLQVIEGNAVDKPGESSGERQETKALYKVAAMVIGSLKEAL